MRLHAHSFSRIISFLFPSLFPGAFLFSLISKGRWTIFMRSLSARHSRMVAQGQFLAEFPEKWSDFLFGSAREPLFFALLSVSLHFCPAPIVKSVQKTLKRAFFRPFWAVLRGIKTPEKVLKKPEKTAGASQKMAIFWWNRAFLTFQKSLLDDFRQNFSWKAPKIRPQKGWKTAFGRIFWLFQAESAHRVHKTRPKRRKGPDHRIPAPVFWPCAAWCFIWNIRKYNSAKFSKK